MRAWYLTAVVRCARDLEPGLDVYINVWTCATLAPAPPALLRWKLNVLVARRRGEGSVVNRSDVVSSVASCSAVEFIIASLFAMTGNVNHVRRCNRLDVIVVKV